MRHIKQPRTFHQNFCNPVQTIQANENVHQEAQVEDEHVHKEAQVEDEHVHQEAQAVNTKRGRGRPPKRKATIEQEDLNHQEVQVKKRRGRPPKAKSALNFD